MPPDPPSLAFTHDTINHLLRHFDGEGPEAAADIVGSITAFDTWISERSAAGTHTEEELDGYRAGIWFMRGTLADAAGNVDAALSFFRGSTERAARVGDTSRQIISLRSMARCYEYSGKQVESTRCIFEALDLAEAHDDDRATGLALHGLSALYEAQGAYDQVYESAARTRVIAERIGDPHLLARACGALAVSCGWLDRADEGIGWLHSAVEMCEANNLDQTGRTIGLNLIFLYLQAGRVDDAVTFADSHLDLIASLPAQQAAAIYVDVAAAHLAAGNLSVATEMLRRADDVSDDQLMQAHLRHYYRIAADLHTALGDDTEALAMLRRYMEHDSEVRGLEAEARLVAVERHFAAEIRSRTEEIHHLRTVELVEKNRQLSDLLQQNEEILHVVVHDLRNPLAAAQLLGESLTIDLADRVEPEALQRLQAIGGAAIEMRQTVDTLMASQPVETASRLDHVARAVRLAVAAAIEGAIDRDITLDHVIDDVDLVVNTAVLRRSLDDLLWNAIASSQPGSTVQVGLTSRPGGGARITIAGRYIQFTGPESDGRNLYIARRLIERMRGSIDLTTSPDGALTTISIELRP